MLSGQSRRPDGRAGTSHERHKRPERLAVIVWIVRFEPTTCAWRWRWYELHVPAGLLPGRCGAGCLALRNQNLFGPTPLRVIPDISMDADASTGMLIGLHQTFPDGSVRYSQFKEGG
jgi:hypothetical protein